MSEGIAKGGRDEGRERRRREGEREEGERRGKEGEKEGGCWGGSDGWGEGDVTTSTMGGRVLRMIF